LESVSVPQSVAARCLCIAFAVAGCALVAGCVAGDRARSTDSSTDRATETRAKPPDDRDRLGERIVLRPQLHTVAVGSGQVFIATVYDADNKPRRKRKVEWHVEGAGSIVEIDEGGTLPGRGIKSTIQYAFSQTSGDEHTLTRGKDEFTVRPGQTWCMVRSAVEGETTVIAHCTDIANRDRNQATATVYWTDQNLRFPQPGTARAGGEFALSTNIGPPGDRSAGYRVRYRILDGPAAALTGGRGAEVDSVTDAAVPVGEDGIGRVNITQPVPVAGTNRIGIEVVKSDSAHPGQVVVVSRSETRVTWQSVRLDVSVSAPKFLGLNQDATITYTVGTSDKNETGTLTLTAKLPPELALVAAEPKAAVDDDTLIWTLPATEPGKPQTVKAIVRPSKNGTATLAAEARTEEGFTGRGAYAMTIADAKLLLKFDGPSTGLVGESLPFKVTVTNTGDGPADRVRVQGKVDDGLELASRAGGIDEAIATLGPGQSKTIAVPLTARQAGKLALQFSATADHGLAAVPQTAAIQVREAQLALSLRGPARGFVGQEAVWNLVLQNTGDVPIENVSVKVMLPDEVALSRTTQGGKQVGKQVAWALSALAAHEERIIAITAVCNKPADRTAISATATGAIAGEQEGGRRGSSTRTITAKPAEAPFAIAGAPALQLSVKDSADPARVGQRVAYTVRVANRGTLVARKIEVFADVPEAMTPTRGTGPTTAATITKQRVVFPVLETLAPNAEATFVVEAEARLPGEMQFAVEVRSATQSQPLRAVEPTKIISSETRPFDR
jgi:hypothetical protein